MRRERIEKVPVRAHTFSWTKWGNSSYLFKAIMELPSGEQIVTNSTDLQSGIIYLPEKSIVHVAIGEIFLNFIKTVAISILLIRDGDRLLVRGFDKKGYLSTTGQIIEFKANPYYLKQEQFITVEKEKKAKRIEEVIVGKRKILREVEDEPTERD